MSNALSQIPPGWYPDPSGGRQWRVWNGTAWSDVTRPYGEPVSSVSSLALDTSGLVLVSALHRLTQFGILAYYAGFALLVSLVAHWPGQPHPVSARFASATLGAAIGLTLIGAISFGVTVRALRGRWTLDAVLPLVNTFAVSYLTSQRIGITRPSTRVTADAVITLGFVVLSPAQPWVGIALAGLAFSQLARTYVLSDRLLGPAAVAA
ncbi:MAG TPA: DUF2510 domain-containing protein [Acidimicrobiales bacterium]